jgi:hypothetical protein
LAAEPRAFLFEFKFSNINGIRPEVVKLPRDESELLVLLKIVTGVFVVAPCLFIGARLHGLLLFESAIGEVLPSRKLIIDPHCVNELPMAGAFLTRPASTNDPISFFRQFNNIPPFDLWTFTEFTATQGTKTKIGVGCVPIVMLNDVGVKFHHNLLYRLPSRVQTSREKIHQIVQRLRRGVDLVVASQTSLMQCRLWVDAVEKVGNGRSEAHL